MRKTIGIVSAGWDDEYQRNILSGITEACAECDFTTISLTSSNIDFTSYAQNMCAYNAFNLVSDEYMDGLILVINTIYYQEIIQQIIQHAEQLSIPVILVDHKNEKLMTIGTDNYASARLMTEHLFEGDERKRFACITGVAFNSESEARVNAFKDVVMEKTGFVDEDYIFSGNFQYESGWKAADYWHNSDKEYPDALFCCNDKMAIGFLERSLDLGYRVPEDVKIVGFDNSLWGQSVAVPISSIQCPLKSMGKQAVYMLRDTFTGQASNREEKLVGEPVFRLSSGVQPDTDPKKYYNLYHSSSVRRQNENDTLFLANLMVERFSFCNSVDDFLYRLQDIVHRIHGDEFYLCFTKEQMLSMGNAFETEELPRLGYMLEGYSSHMYMLVHYEDERFHDSQIFETKKILPVFDHPKDKRMDYVVFPLYFMGKTHGYCVLGNCNTVAYTGVFQTCISLLSYAANNIYMRHELEQKAHTLEYLHERDSLTETYNRLGFKRHSQEMLQLNIEQGTQMMILFADMDGMKAINDHFGHEEGDIAICTFSNILKQTCQSGEIISRFGGDEMLVLGSHYSEAMAKDFLHRFQKALDNYNASHTSYQLRVSVGYEIFTPDPNTNIEDFIMKADEKMYDEKRKRKTNGSR